MRIQSVLSSSISEDQSDYIKGEYIDIKYQNPRRHLFLYEE